MRIERRLVLTPFDLRDDLQEHDHDDPVQSAQPNVGESDMSRVSARSR